LEIRFIDYFNTRFVTTLNCNAIADYTLQITTAHAKSFQSAVFTSRSLDTAPNSGDSSASVLTSLLSGEYPTTAPTKPSNYRLHYNFFRTVQSPSYFTTGSLQPIISSWRQAPETHNQKCYFPTEHLPL
jgi:hypothetical protein